MAEQIVENKNITAQMRLLEDNLHGKKTKRVQSGIATSNVICSAFMGNNSDIFPQILRLHVPPNSTVADVTYGKGIFGKNVESGKYVVKGTDIQMGVDCRDLPYEEEAIDCVVLDPPYMEGLFRADKNNLAGNGTYRAFRYTYSNGEETKDGPKYHAAVLDLYYKAGHEAHRVLKNEGILIVKCQDEVSANKQELTHVQIINNGN